MIGDFGRAKLDEGRTEESESATGEGEAECDLLSFFGEEWWRDEESWRATGGGDNFTLGESVGTGRELMVLVAEVAAFLTCHFCVIFDLTPRFAASR